MSLSLILAVAIGGPFPLLCTPYTEKGEVDCAVLAKKTGGWTLEDLKLTPGQIAEIDARLKFAGIE